MSRKRAERGAERLIDAVGAVLATPAGKARIDCLARRIAGTADVAWCEGCAAAPNCATLQDARLTAVVDMLDEVSAALIMTADRAEWIAQKARALTMSPPPSAAPPTS